MENFSSLFVYSDLVSQAMKICQYTLRLLSSQRFFLQTLQKIFSNIAGLRRLLRLFNTLTQLIKLYSSKSLNLKHVSNLTQLIFNVLDHFIIYYQKSPDSISALVSLLRNWTWVLNCGTQIAVGCYKTALIRQKLQNLRDANAHNKYSEKKREYENLIVKDRVVQMETMEWIFDLPLAVYCCDPHKLHPGFVACMGIVSAVIGVLVGCDKVR